MLRHTRFIHGAAVVLLIGVTAFPWALPEAFADSPLRGWFAVAAWLILIVQGVPQAVLLLSYRLRVGDDFMEVRTLPWRSRTVPFHRINGFVEDLYSGSYMFLGHVLRFRFLSEELEPVSLTAAVPGWAAAIRLVHRSIPWAVPDPGVLVARAAPKHRKLAGLADTVPSPGQDIPEEWSWAKRVKTRDWLVGYGLSFLVVVPSGVGLALFCITVLDWRQDAVRVAVGLVGPAVGVLLGRQLTLKFRLRRLDQRGWGESHPDADPPSFGTRRPTGRAR